MILIEDRTNDKYDTNTVEVWSNSMNLRFKIENSHVESYSDHYDVISYTGEHIATFPSNETVFMMKTPETKTQITQDSSHSKFVIDYCTDETLSIDFTTTEA